MQPPVTAQRDIGQTIASTRRKAASLAPASFHESISLAYPLATTAEKRPALAVAQPSAW
jgi:hypothetical protein